MTARKLSLPFAHKSRFTFRLQSVAFCLASTACLLLSGCDRKPGLKASLAQLEKAFPPASTPAQTEQPTPGQPARADASACVLVAVAAARSNDYATAVVMLNRAVRAPGMTPDQFLAVQQAKTVLFTDLEKRAEKGDATAQAALNSIEQSRSH